MSKTPPNAPMPLGTQADTLDRELALLLDEPFATAWQHPAPPPAGAAIRGRLLNRLDASRQAEAAMTTARRLRSRPAVLVAGVAVRTLYAAPSDRPLRPGEPLRARLLELDAGTTLAAQTLDGDDAGSRHRELLVLAGCVEVQGQQLSQRDYHVIPAGSPMPTLFAAQPALLFLREADLKAQPGDRPYTVLDAAAGWPDYAPGIQRRVLWQREGQAALLYCAQPGAEVPQHRHGHDEECLMVQGELFLDDLLLQPGDYQLAPAGSGHRVTETDTGVVLYAHGDLELRFVG